MYIITVKFAPLGAPLSNGGYSKTGHAWYEGYNTELRYHYSRGWNTGDSKLVGKTDNI